MHFVYITSNVPGDGVSLEDFEEDLKGCACKDGDCSIESCCSCLKISGEVFFSSS